MRAAEKQKDAWAAQWSGCCRSVNGKIHIIIRSVYIYISRFYKEMTSPFILLNVNVWLPAEQGHGRMTDV